MQPWHACAWEELDSCYLEDEEDEEDEEEEDRLKAGGTLVQQFLESVIQKWIPVEE